jgi:hypothetical protein
MDAADEDAQIIGSATARLLSGEYPHAIAKDLRQHTHLVPALRNAFVAASVQRRQRGKWWIIVGSVISVLTVLVVIVALGAGCMISGAGAAPGFVYADFRDNQGKELARHPYGGERPGHRAKGPIMSEAVTYVIVAGLSGAKQILSVTDDRFSAQAPLVKIDTPLSAIRHYCIEPIETATHDACLVMTWDQDGKTRSKKIPIKRSEKSFEDFLAALLAKRPDASLLDIDYSQALKQMGVMSTKKLAGLIVIGIFAAIFVVAATVVTVKILTSG